MGKNQKKILLVSGFCILLIAITLLTTYILNREEGNNNELESWISSYTYSEFVEPNINMFYSIDIYQIDDVYLAKFQIDGFQTMLRFEANVIGDKNKISFIFDDYLEDNIGEIFDVGDTLLSFYNEGGELLTEWVTLRPIELNQISKEVFFTSTK